MNQKNFTLLLFAVLFFVFSFLGYILYTGIEETGEKKEWEVKTVKVKEKINQLRRLNFKLESLNRGFALTLDSVYVNNQIGIKTNIMKTLHDLDSLVEENSSQIKRLNVQGSIFQKKFDLVDSLRALAATKMGTRMYSALLMESKMVTDDIEVNCNLMLEEQDALLFMRENAYNDELSASKKSLLSLVIGLLFILIAVTIFLFRIFNHITATKQIAEQKNRILEKTKSELISTNESLNILSKQFESSLQKSNVAAFEWADTREEPFWLSNSIYEMLGMSKEDFLPTVTGFFTNLMHPDDSPKVQKTLENHVKNGEVYNPEYRLKRKDGSYGHFRALASTSIKNGIQSMTGVIIDIDEEMKLRESRVMMNARLKEYGLRFDLVLTSSGYGVWDWFDIRETQQWWSDSFYDLIGYTPDEMEPTVGNFHLLIHPEDLEITEKAIGNNIEFGTGINIEYRLKTKKGGYKWFRGVGNRVLDENDPSRIRLIGVVSDISKEKMISEELKRSNSDLQNFAYVASHDLQEPLRKIQAFGDRLNILVNKNYPDFEGLVYVEKMNNSASRMRKLIDDLLNYSRISTENNFTEKVDLNNVLADVKDLLSETIESAGATLKINDLPIVHEANLGNLVQLFQNLISNAVKFGKEGIAVHVEVKSTQIDVTEAIKISPLLNVYDNYYKIEVIDNGIGFNEQYLKKIFTIFQRLHGRTEYQGTGIGLAVCQKICENHDGFITAQATEGEGATFIVILPEIKK